MARSGVVVTVDVRALRKRLEELPEDVLEALKRAIRLSAEAVRDDTKRRVRVDSGALRSGVRIELEDEGLTARVGWPEDAHYYARFQEFGTRRSPAQPALVPALEAERSKVSERISDEVRDALRRSR
ncbi:HK97-gp10 family putative phage morphogenesis protein [Yinghuangia sp. YIM S09857]|uniref:HK97-gp10 family putative phage morphogenesis protein n=1 Tax=Yinghuangia sp. YIM S09857 TaxID=3436929 RepID=UPI003F5309F1